MRKLLVVLMVGCFLLGMATRKELEKVEKKVKRTTTKSEKSYRIEIAGDSTKQRESEEIRFISPQGKVIKTLEKYWYKENVKRTGKQWTTELIHVEAISEKKNAVLLWRCKYSTDYDPRGKEGPHGRRRQYTLELLNKKGEIAFKKDFRVFHPGAMAIPFWKTDISKDGSTVFVFYGDSLGLFHIEIYDTTGKKLAEAEHPNDFYGEMQISPDGKIFGANTYQEGLGKCMLFLDVESGRTKIVKAEGEGWAADFALPPEMATPLGKIHIGWGIYEDPNNQKWVKGGYKYLTFDEIPSELTTLFGGEISGATGRMMKVDKGGDYKIEIAKVKVREVEKEEIRFVSSEGKVVKTLEKYWYKENVKKTDKKWTTEISHVEAISEKKNAVLLWRCKYSTDYDPRGKEGPHGRRRQYTLELLNKKGEIAFKKDFRVFHPGAMAIPFWKTDISKDGSTVFVFYGDSLGLFHIEIYDTTGKKLAEAEHPNDFYGEMQISPDGKIFGANTYQEGLGKCILFLDVESGRTKIVKAEGEGWRGYFIMSSTSLPPESGKVRLGWQPLGEKYDKIPGGGVKTKDITFDQIPSDIFTLFGGEK